MKAKPGILSLGDLLDLALRMYFGNFVRLFGIIAVGLVPNVLISIVIGPSAISAGGEDWKVALVGAVLYLVTGLVILFQTAALISATSSLYVDDQLVVSQSFRVARRHLLTLMGASILYGIVMFFGFLAFIIPGIFVAVAWLFYFQVVVLEGLGPVAALKRSGELVAGNWWRVLGVYFVIGALVGAVQVAITMPLGIVAGIVSEASGESPLMIVAQAVSGVVGGLLSPIQIVGATLLYYDLRARKEGFDILVAAQAIEDAEGVGTPV